MKIYSFFVYSLIIGVLFSCTMSEGMKGGEVQVNPPNSGGGTTNVPFGGEHLFESVVFTEQDMPSSWKSGDDSFPLVEGEEGVTSTNIPSIKVKLMRAFYTNDVLSPVYLYGMIKSFWLFTRELHNMRITYGTNLSRGYATGVSFERFIGEIKFKDYNTLYQKYWSLDDGSGHIFRNSYIAGSESGKIYIYAGKGFEKLSSHYAFSKGKYPSVTIITNNGYHFVKANYNGNYLSYFYGSFFSKDTTGMMWVVPRRNSVYHFYDTTYKDQDGVIPLLTATPHYGGVDSPIYVGFPELYLPYNEGITVCEIIRYNIASNSFLPQEFSDGSTNYGVHSGVAYIYINYYDSDSTNANVYTVNVTSNNHFLYDMPAEYKTKKNLVITFKSVIIGTYTNNIHVGRLFTGTNEIEVVLVRRRNISQNEFETKMDTVDYILGHQEAVKYFGAGIESARRIEEYSDMGCLYKGIANFIPKYTFYHISLKTNVDRNNLRSRVESMIISTSPNIGYLIRDGFMATDIPTPRTNIISVLMSPELSQELGLPKNTGYLVRPIYVWFYGKTNINPHLVINSPDNPSQTRGSAFYAGYRQNNQFDFSLKIFLPISILVQTTRFLKEEQIPYPSRSVDQTFSYAFYTNHGILIHKDGLGKNINYTNEIPYPIFVIQSNGAPNYFLVRTNTGFSETTVNLGINNVF